MVDPLGGAPVIEALTDELEAAIAALLGEIEARGGALACIESGWFQDQLSEAAYRQTLAVEGGEKTVIGVNRFVTPSEPIEVFAVDPVAEQRQIASLGAVRARRAQGEVAATLDGVERAARNGENVVPGCVEAVKAYATVGEIVARLKAVFGEWRPTRSY
jgi:methylmalonyl-CoA mutase N-terminal domain/subunit